MKHTSKKLPPLPPKSKSPLKARKRVIVKDPETDEDDEIYIPCKKILEEDNNYEPPVEPEPQNLKSMNMSLPRGKYLKNSKPLVTVSSKFNEIVKDRVVCIAVSSSVTGHDFNSKFSPPPKPF